MKCRSIRADDWSRWIRSKQNLTLPRIFHLHSRVRALLHIVYVYRPLTSCIVASSTLFVLLTPTSLPLPPIAKPRIAYAARSKPFTLAPSNNLTFRTRRSALRSHTLTSSSSTEPVTAVAYLSHTATRVALDVALSTHRHAVSCSEWV